MKELDTSLRDLVAAVRAAYQPTLAHDAMVRAAIIELTQLDEATSAPPAVSTSIWRPEPEVAPAPPRPAVGAATESAAIAILDAALTDRTIAAAYAYKEQSLRLLFASLRPIEANALRQRLERASADDALATRFARLAPDRRARLIATLADARRREARGAR